LFRRWPGLFSDTFPRIAPPDCSPPSRCITS